jgi:hypothetical protein
MRSFEVNGAAIRRSLHAKKVRLLRRAQAKLQVNNSMVSELFTQQYAGATVASRKEK